MNYVFLVPWILFSLPATAFFQQQAVIAVVLTVLGLAGMFTESQSATFLASASLLGLIVWGKVASDLYGLTATDSALLLLEFMIVILLMEFSSTAISFHKTYDQLRVKNDETSREAQRGLVRWARIKFLSLARLMGVAFGLSLGLLVVGDLVSVSVNQIAFSGILVIAAVVALLILLTYGREPEENGRRGKSQRMFHVLYVS